MSFEVLALYYLQLCELVTILLDSAQLQDYCGVGYAQLRDRFLDHF